MRRLAQQRHEAIATLVSEARGLARKAGQLVTHDAARELETTLSATLADEGAAAKVRSGRLTSALEYSGFAPLEQAPHPSGRTSTNQRDRPGTRAHSQALRSGYAGATM